MPIQASLDTQVILPSLQNPQEIVRDRVRNGHEHLPASAHLRSVSPDPNCSQANPPVTPEEDTNFPSAHTLDAEELAECLYTRFPTYLDAMLNAQVIRPILRNHQEIESGSVRNSYGCLPAAVHSRSVSPELSRSQVNPPVTPEGDTNFPFSHILDAEELAERLYSRFPTYLDAMLNAQVIRPRLQNTQEIESGRVRSGHGCLPASASARSRSISPELSRSRANSSVNPEGDTSFPFSYILDAEDLAEGLYSRFPTYLHAMLNAQVIRPILQNPQAIESGRVRSGHGCLPAAASAHSRSISPELSRSQSNSPVAPEEDTSFPSVNILDPEDLAERLYSRLPTYLEALTIQTSLNVQGIRPRLHNPQGTESVRLRNSHECLPASANSRFISPPLSCSQANPPVTSQGGNDFPPAYILEAEELAQRLSVRPPTYLDAMNTGLIPPPLYDNETSTVQDIGRGDLPPSYESLHVHPVCVPSLHRNVNPRSNIVQYTGGNTVHINISNPAPEQKQNIVSVGYWIAVTLFLLTLLVYFVIYYPYTPGMWVTAAVLAMLCIKATAVFSTKKWFNINRR